jgi:ClpP protease-like protein
MERDYFMSVEEAEHYGITDTVIAHRVAPQQPAPAPSTKRTAKARARR